MSAVKDLISTLYRSHGIVAGWVDTAGGCMAVEVLFGAYLPGDSYLTRYAVLIVDRECVFSGLDHNSDENVSGFNAGFYALGDDGEYVAEGITIYRTSDDAGMAASELDPDDNGAFGTPVDLPAEVVACADAVAFVVRVVQDAHDMGRTIPDPGGLAREVMMRSE